MKIGRCLMGFCGALLVFGFGEARGECKIEEQDTNGDGQVNWVILENEFYRLKFAGPQERGGACHEALYKPTGQDVNGGASYNWRRWYLMRDYPKVTPAGKPMDDNVSERLINRGSWSYRILKNAPEEASVEFSMRMPEMDGYPWFPKIVEKRRVTLKAGSALVNVEVEAVNEDAESHGLSIQIENGLGIQGEDFAAFLPDAEGTIAALDSAAPHSSFGSATDSPAAAWAGGRAQSGTGGVYNFDYPLMDVLEFGCFGTPGTMIACGTRNLSVAPKGSYKFAYTFQAFSRFRSLDGSVPGLAAGASIGSPKALDQTVDASLLSVGKTAKVDVTLNSAAPCEVVVEAAARILPEEKPTPVGASALKLEAGKTGQIAFDYTPAKEGLHVLTFVVKEGGKVILSFDKTFTLGKTTQVYNAPMPQVTRLGQPDASLYRVDQDVAQWQYKLDLSRVTPHVPWGKPWYRGTTGVLFVSERDFSVIHWREIYERMDIAMNHVLMWNKDYPRDEYRRPALRRLQAELLARQFDTIVLTNIYFDKGLTEEIRAILYQLVAEEGKGLVVVGDASFDPKEKKFVSSEFNHLLVWLKDAQWVTDRYLFDATPLRGAHPSILAFKKGSGRVLIFPARGRSIRDNMAVSMGAIARLQGDPLRAPRLPEYGYALLGKAILWTAQRDSDLSVPVLSAWGRETGPPQNIGLTGFAPEVWNGTVMPRILPASVRTEAERRGEFMTVVAQVASGSQLPLHLVAELTVRDMWYEEAAWERRAVIAAPGEALVTIPVRKALPTGIYLVDLVFKDSLGRSAGWASSFVEVRRDVALKLAVDREAQAYREGETVSAAVEITKRPEGMLHGLLSLQAVDSWGRLVWRHERPVALTENSTKMTLALEPFRPVDVLHDLTATLSSGGEALARDATTFYIYPRRPRFLERFSVSAWGGLTVGYLDRYLLGPTHYELGYDIIRGDREAYRHHAQLAALSSAPGLNGILRKDKDVAKTGKLGEPLLLSPEREQKLREALKLQAQRGLPLGIDYYFGDDERGLPGNIDQSDYTTEGFRARLKKTYGTLDRLNKQWDSNFKDFSEILPQPRRGLVEIKSDATGLRTAEAKAGAADAAQNPSAWFDWRSYMGSILTDQYNKLPLEALREGNPNAGTGFVGTYGTAANAQDWSVLGSYLTMTGCYPGPEEYLRSFAPESVRGPWTGYGMTVEPSVQERLAPWRTLFQGGKWMWYWEFVSEGFGYGAVDYDGTPHRAHMILKREEYDDIKRGIDALFFNTKFVDDGIALPYSYATILVEGDAETGAAARVLKELGRQYTYYARQHVESGELPKRGVKLLALPDTSCMSDAEVAQVRSFVEKGGTLVAHYRVATRDEHGKRRGRGALDDLFGVDRAAAAPEKASLQQLKLGAAAPAELQGMSFETRCYEPGLRLAKGSNAWARYADGTPAIIYRRERRGRCFYLNASLYSPLMTISPRAESQKIYEVILAQANVPRRVTIAAPKGSESAVLDSELVYYQRPGEGALYVGGLFPKATLLTPVEVRFPAKAHLYDVRQGKYFGHADRLADTIHEKGAKVYAALPYRVVALGTSLERPSAETPYRAGEDVSFTVSVAADAKPGLHIIHLRVYSAAGSEVEAHRCNLVAEKGAARHSFPLALNAPEGRWRILLTDVASGVQGVVWFDVVR